MPDAIIFVPPELPARRWLKLCAEHCRRMGYSIIAVARDWDDVVRMVQDDGIEVVVVGQRDHLPADRPWRIEAVAEHTQDTVPPTQRRPQRRA